MEVSSAVPRSDDAALSREPLCALATAVALLIATVASTTTEPGDSVTVTSAGLTLPERAAENSAASATRTAALKLAMRGAFAASALYSTLCTVDFTPTLTTSGVVDVKVLVDTVDDVTVIDVMVV
jgi:hypothetical protein